jgi:uncharacterized protein (TIGR03382 family)
MRALLIAACLVGLGFTWNPPGELEAGNEGRRDDRVWVPGMRFPLEASPAFPNSQVYRPGGSHGGGGGQCDARNYDYPWSDNFCEPRRWDMPLCPGGTGHQGQDIRPATCARDVHWAVAAEDGQITHIGSYSVYLQATSSGVRHRYLHLKPSSVLVSVGQRVRRGDRIGLVSNAFFDSEGNPVGTTYHLHYDIHMHVAELGRGAYIPPYMSLVRSYEELLGQPGATCEAIPPEGALIDEQGPCFRRYGSEQYWRHVDDNGEGGHHLWTNAFLSDEPANWATWQLDFEVGGKYLIEVNALAPFNRATRVPYRVRHAGEETPLIIDQTGVDGWIALGEFAFAAGAEQSVSVYDNSGEEDDDLHITVDAVRVTKVEEPMTTDAGPAPIDAGSAAADAGSNAAEPSGCGCTGSTGLGAFFLVLLPALRRRREDTAFV